MTLTLTTARLLIRPPALADRESSLAIWKNKHVTEFSGGPASDADIEAGFMADLLKKSSPYGFRTVIELSTGSHIGDCGLLQKEIESKSEIELVYFFHPKAWGKGYATEAARALLANALDRLALTRVVSLIHPENERSRKVATKIGMTLEKKVTTPAGNLRDLFCKQVAT